MNTLLTRHNLDAVPSHLRSDSAFRLKQTYPLTLPEVEARYHAAKARLLAAQDEKAEASVEFERARAALRVCLEEIWPERGEG